MIDNNYTYSKELLRWALEHRVPFIYASSASVYGMTRQCTETPDHEGPLNVYAYSKLLFDNYMRQVDASDHLDSGWSALLQRLRPARGAQGAHGVDGLAALSSAQDSGRGATVRGDRRLRGRRAEARFRLRGRCGRRESLLRIRSSPAGHLQRRYGYQPELSTTSRGL